MQSITNPEGMLSLEKQSKDSMPSGLTIKCMCYYMHHEITFTFEKYLPAIKKIEWWEMSSTKGLG